MFRTLVFLNVKIFAVFVLTNQSLARIKMRFYLNLLNQKITLNDGFETGHYRTTDRKIRRKNQIEKSCGCNIKL